jgi:hypothetical protein
MRWLTRRLKMWHRNDRGSIAVLTLFVVWSFVAMVAVVWNTGEYAVRRNAVQTAADTSAHAAASWLARGTNLITATNMQIVEVASAEAIWQAERQILSPTYYGGIKGWLSIKRTHVYRDHLITPAKALPSNEVRETPVDPLRSFEQMTRSDNRPSTFRYLSRDGYRVFTDNLYYARDQMNGALGLPIITAAQRSLTPPMLGITDTERTELEQMLFTATVLIDLYEEVLRGLDEQLDITAQLEARVANSVNTQDFFALQRRNIFENFQRQVFQTTPGVLNEQRQRLVDFYNMDVATVGAEVPPVREVMQTNVPNRVFARSTQVQDFVTGKDRSIRVIGGTYGAIVCPPLRRNYYYRAALDKAAADAIVMPYLNQIDASRARFQLFYYNYLDYRLRTAEPQYLDTMTQIADRLIRRNEPRTVTTTIKPYTQLNYKDYTQFFLPSSEGAAYTDAFLTAPERWNRTYNPIRETILSRLGDGDPVPSTGQRRAMYVLATYNMYPIPEWAKPAVWPLARDYMRTSVYDRNYQRLWNFRYNEVLKETYESEYARLINAGVSDGEAKRQARDTAETSARSEADIFAKQIGDYGARMVAEQGADMWIGITWPYEINPPQIQVPPTLGLQDSDRHQYMTVLSAAVSRDTTNPKLTMTNLLNEYTVSPVAGYAQAEAFNWMEFNGSYGGGDRFDQLWPPRPWRVSTFGGWSWQPKITYADRVGYYAEKDGRIRGILQRGGVPNPNGSLDVLNKH